jgi:signal transduction histidine kinase
MKSVIRTDLSQLQQIRKLTEVSRVLTYAASIDEVLQLTVDHAADLLQTNRSLLMITDPDGILKLRSSHGVDSGLASQFNEPMNEAIVSRLATLFDSQPEHFLGVPLVVAGAVKGILVVIRSTGSRSAEQDEWYLSALADQAAIALEKSRLDEVGEFREQLIGIVGHDLRNPLSSILMSAQLLMDREGAGQREIELAKRIERNASQAARLIDQLLDLTRSRLGGGIQIDATRFDLNDVCLQVVNEVRLLHPTAGITMDLGEGMTGMWDRDRIYQLLSNLIGNALQHGAPDGPVYVRTEAAATAVTIEVTNGGAPIPSEVLPFIFEAFRQAKTGPSSRPEGLGLGLYIARQIVQSHRGTIAATSSESDGTSLTVQLPLGPSIAGVRF